tara:strand:+ start:2052 stop:2339 length:288 start_codon:yes stop_codon:yes gene_type:complete
MTTKVNTKEVTKLFAEMEDLPENVMKVSGKYFKRITPIDKGNARRRTSTSGTTINANYGYAARLDEGWSRQAPEGMSDPTIDFIEKELDKQIKRL